MIPIKQTKNNQVEPNQRYNKRWKFKEVYSFLWDNLSLSYAGASPAIGYGITHCYVPPDTGELAQL